MKVPNDVDELQALADRRKQRPRFEAKVYVEKLKAKIDANLFANFWVDTTNDDMLGKKAIEQIKHAIKSDVKRFAGKRIVNANLILRPLLDFLCLRSGSRYWRRLRAETVNVLWRQWDGGFTFF